ncbi:hypothetical protein AN958_04547 [Leucoagaricus sp. SymC.cos]|nr:hypothetical protein AN958_04547 [Leucoagaricus sp. SymC.cos]
MTIPPLSELSHPIHSDGADAISMKGLSYSYNFPIEDRYCIERWLMPNGPWMCLGVFDGENCHGGFAAADFVSTTLPGIIKRALIAQMNHSLAPSDVAKILVDSIRSVDETITEECLSVLSSADAPDQMSTLKDPNFLCSKHNNQWDSENLAKKHHTSNKSEVLRILEEHPEEPHVINPSLAIPRIFGGINLTRALGDVVLKVDPKCFEVVKSIMPSVAEGAHWKYSKTPPYLSNIAETSYAPPPATTLNRYLILGSDGFIGLFPKGTSPSSFAVVASAARHGENLALKLLWEAFGGDSEAGQANYESSYRRERRPANGRIDDTTIIVFPL